MRCSSTKAPAIVLVVAVMVALLVRPGAPPAGGSGGACPSAGRSARTKVGSGLQGIRGTELWEHPSLDCFQPPTALQAPRATAGLRPTPNSTTAAPAAGRAPSPTWRSRAADDGLYIVRFRRYRMAADHLSELEAELVDVPTGSWTWVERRNKAASFPTDFGLLRLNSVHEAAVKVGRVPA